jgi:hypothetical protein
LYSISLGVLQTLRKFRKALQRKKSGDEEGDGDLEHTLWEVEGQSPSMYEHATVVLTRRDESRGPVALGKTLPHSDHSGYVAQESKIPIGILYAPFHMTSPGLLKNRRTEHEDRKPMG